MITNHTVLAEKNREHLRKAVVGKCYTTERASFFYSRCDGDKLGGERRVVPAWTDTMPIRATADAIFVRFTDKKQRHWFAWIHA